MLWYNFRMNDDEFIEGLTKKQRELLEDIQEHFFQLGCGKDKDFVQMECHKRAVQEMRKRLKNEG